MSQQIDEIEVTQNARRDWDANTGDVRQEFSGFEAFKAYRIAEARKMFRVWSGAPGVVRNSSEAGGK